MLEKITAPAQRFFVVVVRDQAMQSEYVRSLFEKNGITHDLKTETHEIDPPAPPNLLRQNDVGLRTDTHEIEPPSPPNSRPMPNLSVGTDTHEIESLSPQTPRKHIAQERQEQRMLLGPRSNEIPEIGSAALNGLLRPTKSLKKLKAVGSAKSWPTAQAADAWLSDSDEGKAFMAHATDVFIIAAARD